MSKKKSVLSVVISVWLLAICAIFGLTSCGNADLTQVPSLTLPLTLPTTNTNSAVGTNLQTVDQWSTEWVFKDVKLMSSSWTTSGTCTGIAYDSNGYPSTLPSGCTVSALTMNRNSWSGETGDYVVLYDGTGTITLTGGNGVSTVTPLTGGRGVFHVTFSTPQAHSGLNINITSSNASPNHVRNIRVLRPGTESTYATQPFTDTFISSLSGYKVIRFLNWQQANNSTLSVWSNRTTPNSHTQAGANGVAVEYMVALCNALNADMWINIPHLATDDFVTQQATLIKNTLNPGLKVYIEYSNEVWNGAYSQFSWAANQGLAIDPTAQDWQRAIEYYSQRTVQIFALWDTVYGSAARTSLVRVMGTQLASSGVTSTALAWNNAYQFVDAVAGAPYFCGVVGDPNQIPGATVDSWSVSQLLSYCADDITGNIHTWQTNQYAIIHGTYGLEMIAYEAGQGMVEIGTNVGDTTMNTLFNNANNSSGMYALYTNFMNQWRADGGGLIVNYTSSYEPGQNGYWGLIRWSGDDLSTAYKYRAVMAWITANPKWW